MRTKAVPNSTRKGDAFELEVNDLLSLKGYAVMRDVLVSGTQIDLIAAKPDGLENTRFLVECTERGDPVGVSLVKEKASALLSIKDSCFIYKLLFVSKSGFTAEARAFEAVSPHVKLMTLDELEGVLIDFQPYANWYLTNYDHSTSIFAEGQLANRYIELYCSSSDDSVRQQLSSVARDWLNDSKNNLLFVLGEFGSGKTSFCRRFAYDLLDERYRRMQAQSFVPILINLRDNRRPFDLQRILTDTLSNLYGVELKSFQAFEHFCTKRHICLLLDGLDEMVDRSDRRTIADCFQQVFLLASLNAKTILTCRTNFFNSHADLVDALQACHVDVSSSNDGGTLFEFPYQKHGRVLQVMPLDAAQIREFISRRSQDPDAVIAAIKRIHDLSDLSRRPVLLDMILSTLPRLMEQSRPVNSALLYEHYTDRWAGRDGWRVSMPLEARQAFCESLAWTMHTSGIEEVGYRRLEAAMSAALRRLAKSADDLDTFKNDLKTCSFLTRFGSGDQFRFAHKSFSEFFIARKLAQMLQDGKAPSSDQNDRAKQRRKWRVDRHRISFPDLILDTGDMPSRTKLQLEWARYFNLAHGSAVFDVEKAAQRVGRAWRLPHRVMSHMDLEMRRVLDLRKPQSRHYDVSLTPEIATFVVELWENHGVPLEDVLTNSRDETLQKLLADILRLNKFKDYVRRQVACIVSHIRTTAHVGLKTAMAAALARCAEAIDTELFTSLRGVLADDGFSYVLFELAARRDDTAKVTFERLLASSDLRDLDRVLCRYGLTKALPEPDQQFVTSELIHGLLRAGGDAEFKIAISLIGCIDVADIKDVEVLKLAFRRTQDAAAKLLIVNVLQEASGEAAWKDIRALAAFEPDKRIRAELFKAEELVRTKTNAAGGKRGRRSGHRDDRVRDALWQSVRSRTRH